MHEPLEVDGANQLELLFTPCIDLGLHAVFLHQLGATDPAALHNGIQDRAGFHSPAHDPHVAKNLRPLLLPPYRPEFNPVEKLAYRVKDRVCNWFILTSADSKTTFWPCCNCGVPIKPESQHSVATAGSLTD